MYRNWQRIIAAAALYKVSLFYMRLYAFPPGPLPLPYVGNLPGESSSTFPRRMRIAKIPRNTSRHFFSSPRGNCRPALHSGRVRSYRPQAFRLPLKGFQRFDKFGNASLKTVSQARVKKLPTTGTRERIVSRAHFARVETGVCFVSVIYIHTGSRGASERVCMHTYLAFSAVAICN